MNVGMRAAAPTTVRLENLTIAHRGLQVVRNLTGEFAAGALTAIVGPNGAGKSSLMRTLAGVRMEHSGRMQRPTGESIAYLAQAASLDRHVPVSVFEVAAMGLWSTLGSFRGLDRAGRDVVEQALAAVGLSAHRRRPIGELSAGQAQRTLFARVLVQDAPLILLDEPFNAVDARTTADLLGLLTRWRHERRTVIAVLHDLDQVRAHFDEVLLLARDPVAWGPTAQALHPTHLQEAKRKAEQWDDDAVRAGSRT